MKTKLLIAATIIQSVAIIGQIGTIQKWRHAANSALEVAERANRVAEDANVQTKAAQANCEAAMMAAELFQKTADIYKLELAKVNKL